MDCIAHHVCCYHQLHLPKLSFRQEKNVGPE
jgi:hypothetical protein